MGLRELVRLLTTVLCRPGDCVPLKAYCGREEGRPPAELNRQEAATMGSEEGRQLAGTRRAVATH